ncbi:MAG: HAD family hydrolase [Thaumarchaeota archaeon]|nr:HAD family hydrolase [Candidatus Calditenuaceae archaeon]MDW8043597.1 HAD family hydrolase [Nitrososphaerota archaeon]
MLDCLMLDLDGTVVEFPHEWIARAKDESVRRLREMGLRVPERVDLTRPLSVILREVLELNGPGVEGEVMRVIDTTFKRYELSAAERAVPRMWVREELGRLNGSLKIAVATNNSREAALKTLEMAGVLKYVRCVVSRDDVMSMKPDPHMLLRAIRLCGSTINGSLYVGDSVVDVLAARSIGIPVILVLGGLARPEDIETARPHFVANDFREVSRLVTKMMDGR